LRDQAGGQIGNPIQLLIGANNPPTWCLQGGGQGTAKIKTKEPATSGSFFI